MSKKRNIGWFFIKLLLISIFVFSLFIVDFFKFKQTDPISVSTGKKYLIPTNPVIITPTAPIKNTTTPTPKPLTFEQMNILYGPCTNTPVFMYHHVQSAKIAKENKQVSLTTNSDVFEEQLKYLQSKGYQTIDIGDLVGFFKNEKTIPQKSIILTFDDGYTDFYEIAYPILQKYNFKAVMFLPTGLVNNYGYLTWPEIIEMKDSGIVYFGNHTWSHYGIATDEDKTKTEIQTADNQLSEHGLNNFKVFAYPYGSSNVYSVNTLKSINYNLAFTTTYGKTLCAKRYLELPRLRTGNLMPSYYGL